MKKLYFLAATIVFFAINVQAQESQSDSTRHTRKQVQMHHRGKLAKLNLSDEQKQQTKEINEDYRKQFAELRKNDNMSAADYKAKTEALKKEQLQKLQNILSPEQKTQLAAQKQKLQQKDRKKAGKGLSRMKSELSLTDEQANKLKQNRETFQEKRKTVQQNNSLSDAQKKEQIKALAKEQKEGMKAILTPEQLEKMKTHGGNKKANTIK